MTVLVVSILMHVECVTVASELLILSLDLVKNRVGVMSPEMRKGFIGTILVGLIDKTNDSKVMKAITKMVEDWVKVKVSWKSLIFIGRLHMDLMFEDSQSEMYPQPCSMMAWGLKLQDENSKAWIKSRVQVTCCVLDIKQLTSARLRWPSTSHRP